jgi:GGDEF domain-containing protein
MKIVSPGVAVREAPQDIRRSRLARLTCATIVAGWCLTGVIAAISGSDADRNAWLLAAIGVITGITWATRRWTHLGDRALQVLLAAASLQATAAGLAFDRGAIAAAGFALMVGALAGLVARTPLQLAGQTALIVIGQLLAAGLGPDRAGNAMDAAIVVSVAVIGLAALSTAIRVIVDREADHRRRAGDARMLHERLSEALSGRPERFALLTLDLAGVADDRLADLRDALAGQLRGGDFVAHTAGDGVSILARTDGRGAQALARRLSAAVATYQREDIGALNAAIGIALYPDDGRTPDELLASADAALAARRESGSRLRLVAPALL